MGSTNFFNQREMEIGEEITVEEEQMLQRLQRKKQKIESQRASMIQRSSSIKKSYPMFQDPRSENILFLKPVQHLSFSSMETI